MARFPYRCRRKTCAEDLNGPRRSFRLLSPSDTVKLYRSGQRIPPGVVAMRDHKCEHCKKPLWFDISRYRRKEPSTFAHTCLCSGYLPYPHREGSRGCVHGPELSAEDHQDMRETLNRSILDGHVGTL